MAPMLSGLRVVMLGRQGSGKGTQGIQLARLLVVPQISVGDVLREAAKSGSPAGRRAATAMERGELVDDNLVVSLVAERLAAVDVRASRRRHDRARPLRASRSVGDRALLAADVGHARHLRHVRNPREDRSGFWSSLPEIQEDQ
jgi:hypothetical protein